MVEMNEQMEMHYSILSDAEVDARLDVDNPKCAFHGYVANRNAVEEFLDMANAAFQVRGTFDGKVVCTRRIPKQIALLGPASVGKTSLVRCFAKTLNLPYFETEAKAIKDKETLFDILASGYKARGVPLTVEEVVGDTEHYILPAGILFIDEIHMMSSDVQDSFLKMIEAKDKTLLLKGKLVDCRHLCIIIATTNIGNLRSAFKSRFHRIDMVRHTLDEVAQIVNLNHPKWKFEECYAVACYHSVPRQAIDFADSVNLVRKKIKRMDAIKLVAERGGIYKDGVTRTAMMLLRRLKDGTDLSLKTVCITLEIEEKDFNTDVLPRLQETERHPAYVTVSSKGYCITDAGKKFLEENCG